MALVSAFCVVFDAGSRFVNPQAAPWHPPWPPTPQIPEGTTVTRTDDDGRVLATILITVVVLGTSWLSSQHLSSI